jgi:hypothetical protein
MYCQSIAKKINLKNCVTDSFAINNAVILIFPKDEDLR